MEPRYVIDIVERLARAAYPKKLVSPHT